MQRLRIVLEFSKNKIADLKLYQELIKYSNPPAHVKDILKGESLYQFDDLYLLLYIKQLCSYIPPNYNEL